MSDKSNRQSGQSYGSVWMAHWMRTNYDVKEQTHNPIQTKTFEIVNKSLKISSKKIGNEKMQSPLFKCDQNTDEMLASKPVFHNLLHHKSANGEGTSKNPRKWLKTDSNAKYSNFAMPKSLQEIFVESDNDCCSLHKMHNCDHDDMETMRVFRSTKVITEVNGNVSSNLRPISWFFGHGNRGVKIQSLSNSTDNEEKKVVRDVKASKVTVRSESSDETNIIDMDSFQEKNPCIGSYSTTSANKALNTTIPDINVELPTSLSENTCPISSKTQSLDMNNHFANANHPIPKSNLSLENSQDPSNRWVKRLKLNSSHFSPQATKTSDFPENLPHEKMGKIFSRILKTGTTSEEQTQSNKDDEKKQGNELLLSHAWIQRWLSNRSKNSEKKAKTVVVCEPQSSKFAVGKEHYPSIAAMALMGKAITGYQQCELQKRGSFTVWNTKAF